MKSFLPLLQKEIEQFKVILDKHYFLFTGIENRTPNSKNFSESLDANFQRNDETISLSVSFSNNSKLIANFFYFKESLNISFHLDFYAKDNSMSSLLETPIICKFEDGQNYLIRYFSAVKNLLVTRLIQQINDGTIDNHYNKFHDQFR